MLSTSVSNNEISKLVSKEHTLLLENAVAHFPETSHIKCKVIMGREFIEIIKEVLRNKHDLVIKAACGLGGRLGMLFGSTAMHLLRKCPCPVWLIKPGQTHAFRQIMAAVDVAPLENDETVLNTQIMELAGSLTRMDKGNLHIVHAWNWVTPDIQHMIPKDIVNVPEQIKNIHAGWLEDLLQQCDLQNLQYQKHVVQGRADEIIPDFAEQHQIDIVVMGTLSRTGIPGFFIGNTAEKILHRMNCSVLAVKPDGFISPVLLD
jgi:nucleotide-binding universal stress UspA family protein